MMKLDDCLRPRAVMVLLYADANTAVCIVTLVANHKQPLKAEDVATLTSHLKRYVINWQKQHSGSGG